MGTEIELVQVKIKHLTGLIKTKEAKLTKYNKSLSDSLSESQTAMFDGMNKSLTFFSDMHHVEMRGAIKKASTELTILREELSKAQSRYEFLFDTQRMESLQFNNH